MARVAARDRAKITPEDKIFVLLPSFSFLTFFYLNRAKDETRQLGSLRTMQLRRDPSNGRVVAKPIYTTFQFSPSSSFFNSYPPTVSELLRFSRQKLIFPPWKLSKATPCSPRMGTTGMMTTKDEG